MPPNPYNQIRQRFYRTGLTLTFAIFGIAAITACLPHQSIQQDDIRPKGQIQLSDNSISLAGEAKRFQFGHCHEYGEKFRSLTSVTIEYKLEPYLTDNIRPQDRGFARLSRTTYEHQKFTDVPLHKENAHPFLEGTILGGDVCAIPRKILRISQPPNTTLTINSIEGTTPMGQRITISSHDIHNYALDVGRWK